MPLQLLPMEESDLGPFQNIFEQAFKHSLVPSMYPNGYSEEAKQFIVNASLKKWRANPEGIRMMKVIDTDLPGDNIVGVARWEFYPKSQTEEEEPPEEASKRAQPPFPPGANEEFFEEFFETIDQYKKKTLGNQPHAYLGILMTLPNHHRRGIGAMHLNWGLEQADKLGLQTYLEASVMGRPLYKRYGFEETMLIPLPHNLTHYGMLRPIRNRNEPDTSS